MPIDETGESGTPGRARATSPLTGYSGVDQPLRGDPLGKQIPGNVLPGFRRPHQRLLFVEFASPEGGRKLLAYLLDQMSQSWAYWVQEVQTEIAKAEALAGGQKLDTRLRWVGLSLTYAGLLMLDRQFALGAGEFAAFAGLPGVGPEPPTPGPVAHAGDLGDVDESSPEHWAVGGTCVDQATHNINRHPLHAIIMVEADKEADLKLEIEAGPDKALVAGAGAAASQIATIHCVIQGQRAALPSLFALSGAGRPLDAVDFRDGIAVPAIEGFDPPLSEGGPETWGNALVPAGEFILGYPSGESDRRPRPFRAWMINGSFHVFRRLTRVQAAQPADDRWTKLVQKVAAIAPKRQVAPPLGAQPVDEVDLELAAAKLIGRWPNGAPLQRAPTRTDYDSTKALTPAELEPKLNDHDYAGDSSGEVTPLFAHVRKMNPRTGNLYTRRLIRRSIPYQTDSGEVGLLFHAYMASIEEQFEYLQKYLANATGFPGGTNSGYDPLIGENTDPAKAPDTKRLQFGGSDWVKSGEADTTRRVFKTTGAVYAFAPSLTLLQVLAGQRQAPPGFFDTWG